MKLQYILGLFLLWTLPSAGQHNDTEIHSCGTTDLTLNQEKQGLEIQKRSKHNRTAKLIKTTGAILYAPFKFKGEQDPSLTDMSAVEDFFLRNSYGKYQLTTTIAPIIELPFTRQQDIDDNAIHWETTLRNELANKGFKSSDYDYYVRRTHSGKPYVTISTAYGGGGGRISMITNSVGVTCHEIGHTLYAGIGFSGSLLGHANFWKADNPNNVIGPGTSVNYGNKFSVMGAATRTRDLSLPHKINVEWLTSDEYYTVYKNGTYRIYPHDRGEKQTGRKYGIKINKASNPLNSNNQNLYYHVEYKNNSGVSEANEGVLLLAASSSTTWLLDSNPGTGYQDAPLAVGKTFRDNTEGITVKTLAKGGADANAWMDVEVTFDDPNSTEKPAEISFVSPKDGQAFDVGATIPLEFSTSQPGVDSYRVILDIESVRTPMTFLAPPGTHTRAIEDLPEGTYELKATVFKGSFGGLVAGSKSITIYVGDGQANTGKKGISIAASVTMEVYPNPVNDVATISYTSSKEITSVSLYDLLGRRVKLISDQVLPTGKHELSFDVNGLSAGVYVIQLSTGDSAFSKKIMVGR